MDLAIMPFQTEDVNKLTVISRDLFSLAKKPNSFVEFKNKANEFLNIYQDNEKFFLTLFLPENYKGVAEYNENNKKPDWFNTYNGNLGSMNIIPLFVLDATKYGIAYIPKEIDYFVECLNLALHYDPFIKKVKRSNDPLMFYNDNKNSDFFITEFFKYTILDEPVNLRDHLADRLLEEHDDFSVEDMYRALVVDQVQRQKEKGFRLAVDKGGKKNILDCVAILLGDNGNDIIINGKKKIVKLFTEFEKNRLKSNSRYFVLDGGEVFMRFVEEKVIAKKLYLQNVDGVRGFETQLRYKKLDDYYSSERGDLKPKIVKDKSFDPFEMYQVLRSPGQGSTAFLISIIAELAETTIYVFDNRCRKLIATGLSNKKKCVILRFVETRFEIIFTSKNDNTLTNNKFIFDKNSDDIINNINNLGRVKIVDNEVKLY